MQQVTYQIEVDQRELETLVTALCGYQHERHIDPERVREIVSLIDRLEGTQP